MIRMHKKSWRGKVISWGALEEIAETHLFGIT